MWAPLIKENMERNKITVCWTDVLTGVDTPARAAAVQAISAACDFFIFFMASEFSIWV